MYRYLLGAHGGLRSPPPMLLRRPDERSIAKQTFTRGVSERAAHGLYEKKYGSRRSRQAASTERRLLT